MPQRSVIPDPFKFAADGRRLSDRIALEDMRRLDSVLVDNVGEVAYSLSGELGFDRRPRLRLEATGELLLRCQRCLAPMEWPLALETTLELVRPGQAIPESELENDEFDAIEATPDMDVVALVEDEIVLAVPFAPRHEQCEAPRPTGGVEKKSPFAALAGFRKSNGAD